MHLSALTSTVLLLATIALAAPAPQAQEDKSNFVIGDGKVGVALWQKDGAGDGVKMDARDLANGNRDEVAIHTDVRYATLEVVIGNGFQPANLRCQVLDNHGREVFGRRGQNLDTTFADGNNGRWTLEPPSKISKVICDPRFIANNRAGSFQ